MNPPNAIIMYSGADVGILIIGGWILSARDAWEKFWPQRPLLMPPRPPSLQQNQHDVVWKAKIIESIDQEHGFFMLQRCNDHGI